MPTDVIAIPLGSPQRHAIVASPSYLKKYGRPRVPPGLLRHGCVRVCLPNGSLFRCELRKRGQTALMDVTGPITLDEASLARIAVLEGVGLGFFMETDARSDVEARRLVLVLEDGRLESSPVGRRLAMGQEGAREGRPRSRWSCFLLHRILYEQLELKRRTRLYPWPEQLGIKSWVARALFCAPGRRI